MTNGRCLRVIPGNKIDYVYWDDTNGPVALGLLWLIRQASYAGLHSEIESNIEELGGSGMAWKTIK